MYNKILWLYSKPKIQDKNTLYLDKKDINHLERIFNKYKLIPESFDEVHIDYLADKEYLIRYIIKELDILLRVNGKFIINSTYTGAHANFIRSKSQIGYEFSVSTDGRYVLTKKNIDKNKIKLEYIKKENTLQHNDSIDKWSFGIITNGQKNDQVSKLIDSIIIQNIPNYEILICGDFKYHDDNKYPIVSIDDVLLKDDIRAPITIKKNRIINKSKYENLMVLHDRYLLPEKWYENMEKYGNHFDILTMPNIGPNGGRVNDWGEHLGKPSQIYTEVFHLLSYRNWSDGWYSQGGMLVIKKSVYEKNRLDERLFWDELEDIQFSQIANLNGLFYYIDINNSVLTFSDRIKETKDISNILLPFVGIKRLLKFIIIRTINFTKHYMNRIFN